MVLLAGCDKTTPAYLMGAASVDLPILLITGGPMLSSKYRGTDVGSGTSVWQFTQACSCLRLQPSLPATLAERRWRTSQGGE